MKRVAYKKLSFFLFSLGLIGFGVFYALPANAREGDVVWDKDPVPGILAGPSGARANGIALGTGAYDGVYVVGNDNVGVDSDDWDVQKYSKDGTLLWEEKLNIFSGFDDIPSDIAVVSDGPGAGVYVTGGCHIASGHDGYWCLEKLDAEGIRQFLREEFIGERESYATSIAIGQDGIYIAGDRGTDSGGQWRVEKRDFNGNLIPSFGNEGKVLEPELGRVAYDVALDTSGLYIVGKMAGGGGAWRIEKRNLTTGDLMQSDESNLSGADDRAFGVAVKGRDLFVVGSDGSEGGLWVIEKRKTSDLSLALDEGFGNGAIVYNNPTPGEETPRKVIISPPFLYVGGDYNHRWRIEKRDIVTGNLLNTYGAELDSDNKSRNVLAIALEGGSLYASGTRAFGWRIEKREIISTVPTTPVAPSGLNGSARCVDTDDPDVDLSWTDNSNNEDGFKIYRGTSAGFTPNDATNLIVTVAPDTTTYADTTPSPSTTYYYKITAFNAVGNSPFDASPAIITDSCAALKSISATLDSIPPSSVIPPLHSHLKATVLNDVGTGNYTYVFTCADGEVETKITSKETTAEVPCVYQKSGKYTAHGTIERSGASSWSGDVAVSVKPELPKNYKEKLPR